MATTKRIRELMSLTPSQEIQHAAFLQALDELSKIMLDIRYDFLAETWVAVDIPDAPSHKTDFAVLQQVNRVSRMVYDAYPYPWTNSADFVTRLKRIAEHDSRFQLARQKQVASKL